MESLFLVQNPSNVEERTFWQEDNLPSLPVPMLKETLEKYLDSCKAVVSEQEYENTKAIVKKFQENEGPQLQKLLFEKAKAKKNWLEDWWTNGYLDFRGPLALLNIAGTSNFDFWPAEPGSQIKRTSMLICLCVKFWLLLREEKLAQINSRDGTPLSMHQFRYIYNTSRVPCKGRDQLSSHFKTIYEGHCSSFIIIFYRKRLYKVETMSKLTGEAHSPGYWYNVFSIIKQNVDTGPGIATLTELDRDTWAEARSYLMALSPENEKNVQDIESAIMCYALMDDNITSNSEMMSLAMTGSYGNRWADKQNNFSSATGLFSSHLDHAGMEGMPVVVTMLQNEVVLRERYNSGKWDESWSEELIVENPTELTFVADGKIDHWIAEGSKIAENFRNNSEFLLFNFPKFGKSELKKLKVHPGAFNEICFQLAYMRRHGKPAPTYETATARAFHHGRTETIRTCTPETVAFCTAMLNDAPNKKDLFQKAFEKYMWLMNECKAGRGCDRHLLGLSAIAQENGQSLPEIFTDRSYTKTGGGGNFILSTSCSGYQTYDGATIPMREDGYGIFYGIMDNDMHYAITTYNPPEGVSAAGMVNYLTEALIDVYNLISRTSAKL